MVIENTLPSSKPVLMFLFISVKLESSIDLVLYKKTFTCLVKILVIHIYLMVCGIQNKMIAQLSLGFKELWTFIRRYHLNNCHFLYI